MSKWLSIREYIVVWRNTLTFCQALIHWSIMWVPHIWLGHIGEYRLDGGQYHLHPLSLKWGQYEPPAYGRRFIFPFQGLRVSGGIAQLIHLLHTQWSWAVSRRKKMCQLSWLNIKFYTMPKHQNEPKSKIFCRGIFFLRTDLCFPYVKL